MHSTPVVDSSGTSVFDTSRTRKNAKKNFWSLFQRRVVQQLLDQIDVTKQHSSAAVSATFVAIKHFAKIPKTCNDWIHFKHVGK